MDEKKCKYCATLIPKAAKICPHCRKNLGWSLPAKIFLGIIVLGAIGSFMGKSGPTTKTETPPPQEAISITSEQLYREYEANEVAADLRYKNRTVKVKGALRDIGKTIGDAPYLNLSTGAFTNQVMVRFPADKFDEKLATFKKGDMIELTGICTGKTLGMVIISLR